MKKIGLLALAVLCLCLSLSLGVGLTRVHAETYSGSCGINANWTLDTDTGVLTITGTGKMGSSSALNELREQATSLVVSDGITELAGSAFQGCASLTSVTLPDSLTGIGSKAFCGCAALETLCIPDTVTSIGNYAFWNCSSLTSVTLPKNLTAIESGTFYGCAALGTLCIPDKVTSIGSYALSGCNSLTSLTLGAKVATIDRNALLDIPALQTFVVSNSNTSFRAVNDVLFNRNGTTLIRYPSDKSDNIYAIPDAVTLVAPHAFRGSRNLTSVIFGDGVQTIGMYAFYACRALTTLSLPDQVTTVGSGAFDYCTSLTTVSIGANLTTLNAYDDPSYGQDRYIRYVFRACPALTSFTVSSGNKYFSTLDGILLACDNGWISLLKYPGAKKGSAYTIPYAISATTHITSVESGAFDCAVNLKELTFSSGVWPRKGALVAMPVLEQLSLVRVDRRIDDGLNVPVQYPLSYYFGDLYNYQAQPGDPDYAAVIYVDQHYVYDDALGNEVVTSMSRRCLPASLRTVTVNRGQIPTYFFENCRSLTEIGLGTNVTGIDPGALSGCTGLTGFQVAEDSSYSVLDGMLCDKAGTTLLYVPVSKAVGSFTVPEGITTVAQGALMDCKEMTELTLGPDVAVLEDDLSGCTALTAVHTAATDVYREVDGVLFSADGSALIKYPAERAGTSYTVPDGTVTIANTAFADCTALTAVTLPAGLHTIEANAFAGCSGLTAITLPASLTTVGDRAFYRCTALKRVTFSTTSADSIGEEAFAYCEKLSVVALPAEHLGSLGDRAFYRCALTSLTFPADTDTIGSGAFSNCTSLSTLVFPGRVGAVGQDAFYNCTALSKVATCSLDDWAQIDFANADATPLNRTHALYLRSGNATDKAVTDVTLSDQVTHIGSYAFYDCALNSVSMPNTVTRIGDYAFYHCNCLSKVNVPSALTQIGVCAFAYCSMSSYDLPESITSVDASAFYHCIYLKTLTLPAGLTSIGISAYADCTALTRVTFSGCTVEIGSNAFKNCTALTGVYISDMTSWLRCSFSNADSNPLTLAHRLMLNSLPVTAVEIPAEITVLGNYMFSGCTALTSFTVPDSVTSIGTGVFAGCSGLTELRLPFVSSYAADYFGTASVADCTAVKTPNDTRYVPTALRTVYVQGGELKASAFLNWTGLETIVLDENVSRSIGSNAFSGCTALRDVFLVGGGTLSIPTGNAPLSSAFLHHVDHTPVLVICTAAELDHGSLTLPFGVLAKGETLTLSPRWFSPELGYRFRCFTVDSGSLSRLTLTVAAGDDFSAVTLGVAIDTASDAGDLGSGLTWGIYDDNVLVILGSGSMSGVSGGSAAPWSEHLDQITAVELTADVSGVSAGIFDGLTALRSFLVSDNNANYISVDGVLFSKDGSTLLRCPLALPATAYAVPNGVTAISAGAFSGCCALERLTIPFVGASASESDKLFGFIFGKTAYEGGVTVKQCLYTGPLDYAVDYSYCIPASLRTVIVTGGTLPGGAFSDCGMLTEIGLSGSVNSIGAMAFAGCDSLEGVYFGGTTGALTTALNGNVTGLADGVHIHFGTTSSDGHTRATVTVAATCWHVGQLRISCDCGYFETKTLPVTQHTVANGVCTGCGASGMGLYFGGGTGTSRDPYLIASPQHLWALAELCTDGNYFSDVYFRQTCDIDLGCTPGNNWKPISLFCGTYDGGCHVIRGLHIFSSASTSVGMFNYLSDSARITGIRFSNCSVRGIWDVGLLAGEAGSGAFIFDCSADASCTVSGQCSSSAPNIGGLVGYNCGRIFSCSNAASVSCSGDPFDLGGICGNHSGAIYNCRNTGTVSGSTSSSTPNCFIGGLVGFQLSSSGSDFIASSCNTGNVRLSSSSSFPSGGCLGGIVGSGSRIMDCYNTGSVSGSQAFCAGIAGLLDSDGQIMTCFNAGSVSGGGSKWSRAISHTSYGIYYSCYYLSGTASDAGCTSLTSSQFASTSYLSGFDFDTTWVHIAGRSLPELQCFAARPASSLPRSFDRAAFSENSSDISIEFLNGSYPCRVWNETTGEELTAYQQYTYSSSTSALLLYRDYLSTLSPGEHVFQVEHTSGYTSAVRVIITDSTPEEYLCASTNAVTDGTHLYLSFTLSAPAAGPVQLVVAGYQDQKMVSLSATEVRASYGANTVDAALPMVDGAEYRAYLLNGSTSTPLTDVIPIELP